MKKQLIFIVSVVLMLGCSSIHVMSDYDTTLDFSKLNTFGFAKEVDQSDFSELVVKRIHAAIVHNLIKKGYMYNEENPDLIIDFHGSKQEKKYKTANTVSTGAAWGMGGWGVGMGPGMWGAPMMNTGMATTTISEQKTVIGTLYINVGNAKDKSIIWKSVTTTDIDNLRNPQQISMKIDQVVAKTLRNFPKDKEDIKK